jgi:glutamyl-Q tRNA(Asp) synthetase
MEDLDPPREEPGAADEILRVLDRLGLEWDGDVVYQSRRYDLYRDAIRDLAAKGLTYYCSCSRREIAQAGLPGIEGNRYPGTCRTARHPADHNSTRMATEDSPIGFVDLLQGEQVQRLNSDIGDFVIQRRDGLFAYQIAVVVDDAEQAISEVVRGSDLLDSTPRQIYLQQSLEISTPQYCHLPVAVGRDGNKLSKQNGASAIDISHGSQVLFEALRFLGQHPPMELNGAKPAQILEWAINHWSLNRIPAVPAIRIES